MFRDLLGAYFEEQASELLTRICLSCHLSKLVRIYTKVN